MNNKTETEPLHDNLRDLIGQAISDEIATGAEQPDWCDSREIDRLADAVLAVLPKRRTTRSPELRAALDEAAKTGATVAEVPGGGLVFINRGEQLEEWADLNCPACGGSGHADDARATAASPVGVEEAFAAFCDREGYPSDGELDVVLRKAFDEGSRLAATPPAIGAPQALSTGAILAIERRGTMTDDEAIRFARQVESSLAAVQPAAAPAVVTWDDKSATQRLRSIVSALGMESVVPDGDLTGYEFSVLGMIRMEIERLKEKIAFAPSPAQAQPVADTAPLIQALHDIAIACNCCGDRSDLAEIAADALEAQGIAIELGKSDQFDAMNHRLARTFAAQPSPAPVEAQPFAYFVQPSSFGPFIECKPDQVGAFPAYRTAQPFPAQGDAPEGSWPKDFREVLQSAENVGYDQGRAAGLEEAAKACDNWRYQTSNYAGHCADAIRALATKPTESA